MWWLLGVSCEHFGDQELLSYSFCYMNHQHQEYSKPVVTELVDRKPPAWEVLSLKGWVMEEDEEDQQFHI